MEEIGNRSHYAPVLIKSDGSGTEELKRMTLTKADGSSDVFSEVWLQSVMEKNPNLLPVEEINSLYAPLRCIGREVSIPGVGSMDLLCMSPEGHITIVEAKLWRNPEATREVVAQILDYAKGMKGWSFDKLEEIARDYTQKQGSSKGLLELIEAKEEDQGKVSENIIQNLKLGRFLLIIAGDGIRDNTEEMIDYLQSYPNMHFTLGLVELKVYKTPESGDYSHVVLPNLVTRTKEIVRAIVKVEGVDVSKVVINADLHDEHKKSDARVTLSEHEFFEELDKKATPDDVELAKQILVDMKEMGCIIEWAKSGYVAKYLDPGGSGRKFTVFVVESRGKVYSMALKPQLERLGMPESIGLDYGQRWANLFSREDEFQKWKDQYLCYVGNVDLSDIRANYGGFKEAVKELLQNIRGHYGEELE